MTIKASRVSPAGEVGPSFAGDSKLVMEMLAPRAGLEPATKRLTAACSTN